ncbi:hypothetical protein [Streptococcus anginosus]|uniref:YolD-like protein n=1 Tax=Streptococcus anginosus TaxID=1328 RepID=A0AAP2K8P0_STRAP|nr:hypothetical protein [Streptococcus anginosus]MBZ2155673.1 hypothetical protein [Streptococcus anginosus]
MIDRSYLPFQSAREYKDRKMQKWMGFFLSEHSSALGDDANQVSYISDLSTDRKLFRLSQAYANQLTTRISVLTKKEIKTFTGTIPSISKEQILLKATTGHENILISDIISIKPVEEVIHEST